MSREEFGLLAAMGLFALGAVALILYQHASATNSVLSALGLNAGVSGNVSAGGSFALGLGQPASLAGTPTVGMNGTSATPAVMPLNVGPGYYMQ